LSQYDAYAYILWPTDMEKSGGEGGAADNYDFIMSSCP